METRLPADNGAKGVRRQALIDSHIFVFIQAADVQVSAVEREARSGPSLDKGVVELPPAGVRKQPKSWSGKNRSVRESFSIHEPGPPSHVLINYMFAPHQKCNQSEMQSATALFKKICPSVVAFCPPKSNDLYSLNISLFFSVCLSIRQRQPHKGGPLNQHQKPSLAILMIARPQGQGTGLLKGKEGGRRAAA